MKIGAVLDDLFTAMGCCGQSRWSLWSRSVWGCSGLSHVGTCITFVTVLYSDIH